ncbi:MAG TPA: glycosyltransferase family 39 protein [Bacteroidia bacterium]|nr:glycosyltransferase family 39 protein [Bacteroidia bacterium]
MEPVVNTKHNLIFIVALLMIFTAGLTVDVMNVDAAQYASMSRDMLFSGRWLEVQCRHHDYLDKPPLLFWLSALSFKIFSVSNWAYKLPSFLFAILGIYSTYRLAELLYDRRTGSVAALMLASCFGVFIMTNDIRTDTLLLGSVVFSIWQLLLYLKTKRWPSLVAGFAGIAVAMLAKGPIGLVIPVMALSCEFAYRRQWKNFFRPEWIAGAIIIAVILFPMSLGLYRQFDLHPEKTVNGSTGVSGLKFFYWTQSFGRITGDSDWGTKYDNGAGPFFFTHTFLWAFFPWSFLVLGGLIKTFIKLVRSRFREGFVPEVISAGGFTLTFIALSLSKYKLPHYIYVTFPLAAILAARFFLYDVFHHMKKYLLVIFTSLHVLFIIALAAASLLITFFIFPGGHTIDKITVVFWLTAAIVMLLFLKNTYRRILYPLVAALAGFYFTGNAIFYPSLLRYESSALAGKLVVKNNVPPDDLFTYHDIFEYALDFYSGRDVEYTSLEDSAFTNAMSRHGSVWIYTEASALDEISAKFSIDQKQEFSDYPVQFLKAEFLDPSRRESTLRKRYLLVISPKKE